MITGAWRSRALKKGWCTHSDELQCTVFDVDTYWSAVGEHLSLSNRAFACLQSITKEHFLHPLDLSPSDIPRWLDIGLRRLIQLRTGFLPLGAKQAYYGMFTDDYKHKCPVCKATCKEDVQHYFFDCRAWRSFRKRVPGLQEWAIANGPQVDGWNRFSKYLDNKYGLIRNGLTDQTPVTSLRDAQVQFLKELCAFLGETQHLRYLKLAPIVKLQGSGVVT